MCTTQDDIKNTKRGILVTTLNSWRDFVELLKDPQRSPGTLIYRGQGSGPEIRYSEYEPREI